MSQSSDNRFWRIFVGFLSGRLIRCAEDPGFCLPGMKPLPG